MKAAYLLAATLLALLAGCGAAGDAATPVVTVTATEPAPTVTATKSAPPATPTGEEAPTRANKPAVAERRTLPDVVGMNLQEAQDTLQAAGFYLISDRDATGQGRFQVFDRNWVVTQQKPAGGRKVPIDALIVLYAKKYGE